MSTNERHGYVARNLQGLLCRCGGPFLCQHCRAEITRHIGPTRGGWYVEATDTNAVGAELPTLMWACRTRELALELARVSAALRDLMDAVDANAGVDEAMDRAEKVLVER